MNLLQQRLAGVLISGQMEPGHTLLDSVMSMVDKNQLKYLPPERCVSRVHELTNLKAPDRMLDIEANKIIIKDKDEKIEAPAHTSLQVLEALKRRGIALEFGDCMGFLEHDKYVQALFARSSAPRAASWLPTVHSLPIGERRQGGMEEVD